MTKVGIVDTMFSRVNMGQMAIDEIERDFPEVEIRRTTVPGVKDLPVECKKLLDGGCDVCMALGMVGGAPIDTQCAHEASLGIQHVKLLTDKHVIEVFVHENEAWSAEEFKGICDNRVRKHAHNAVLIVEKPDELIRNAGMGVRQGKEDEGPVKDEGIRIAIVVSRFNEDVTGRMRKKAVETAEAEGAEPLVMEVPGAYDMPLVAKKALMDKGTHAVVALGAVVKGETAHDEVITKDAAKRLGDLSMEFNKPVTLGIIGHDASADAARQRAEEYAERSVRTAVELVKTLRG
jgi:riboflavin synthase